MPPRFDLVVLFGIVPSTGGWMARLRRRGLRGGHYAAAAAVGFLGLTLVVTMTAHCIDVLSRLAAGTGYDGAAFVYDFRTYSLLLLGTMLIAVGVRLLRVSSSIGASPDARRSALRWGPLPWATAMAAGCATGGVGPGRFAPVADHHQHLFSPDIVALLGGASGVTALGADDLIPLLDSAGIRRAAVLSVAYMYGSPSRTVENEYARVRAENDWAAAQAARYPDRLIAFCGFNPLKDYALEELTRCAGDRHFGRGIKLHFGNSDVQLDEPAHLERLREVFQAANEHGMAIVVHLRASISRERPYGAAQARIFLEQLLPLAADVPVQVAHLAGTGPGYDDPPADSAMAVLADAVAGGNRYTRRLWFDVTSVVDTGISPANAALVARRIRQVGLERVLFGSDAAIGENLRPRESWAAFRRLPLTDDEIARIADNLAPYFGDGD